MLAVINGALIQIIMASRVCYGMAVRRWLPVLFSRVNAVTRTPLLATLIVTLLVLLMALWLPIETLAKSTSYFLLLVFTLVNLSLWRLKYTTKTPAGIIRVPLWVPVAGCLTSGVFVAGQAVMDLLG
jgi:amino acid transporter